MERFIATQEKSLCVASVAVVKEIDNGIIGNTIYFWAKVLRKFFASDETVNNVTVVQLKAKFSNIYDVMKIFGGYFELIRMNPPQRVLVPDYIRIA